MAPRATTRHPGLITDGAAALAPELSHVGTFEVLDLATGRARWSESCWRLLGFDPRSPGGTTAPPRYRDLVHPADRDRVVEEVGRAVEALTIATSEHRVVRGDGQVRWVTAHFTPRADPATGVATSVVGVVVDVTVNHDAERERDRAEATLRVGFERSLLGVGITDRAGVLLTVNPAYCQILGRPAEDLVGRVSATFIHPADVPVAVSPRESMAAGDTGTFSSHHRVVRADGGTRWVHRTVTLVEQDADPIFLTQVLDVTDQHLATERLAHLAHHDELTGLPNRAALDERVARALATVAEGRVVTCLFLDLDDFTVVNDGLGHAAGDELLRQVARRLQAGLEPGDTVARFGGDSFVVVRRDCPPDRVGEVGEDVLAALSEPFELTGLHVTVTGCVGVSSGGRGRSAARLLREADTAVTRAKTRGHQQAVVFDADLAHDVALRLGTAVSLRGAVGRGEVVVHYQPVVDLARGRTVAVEALVRWEHPTRGLVPPDDFIGVAERTGLVVEIGEHVLRESARAVARWRRELPGAHDLRLAVNVSTAQLRDGRLRAVVADALAQAGLPADALALEVTETGLVDDVAGGAARLAALREDGVAISVDDFGTGYSSLAYLVRLPVDAVKLDRLFVAALCEPGSAHRARGVVSGIVALAAALGVSLVAEGVEDAAQVDVLRALGVTLVQGYWLSPPLTGGELESWWPAPPG